MILGTFIKQCLNHESVYPKKLIVEKLKDKNIKIEQLGKISFDEGSSYIATVGGVMKGLNIELLNKDEVKLQQTKLNLRYGRYTTLYDFYLFFVIYVV